MLFACGGIQYKLGLGQQWEKSLHLNYVFVYYRYFIYHSEPVFIYVQGTPN